MNTPAVSTFEELAPSKVGPASSTLIQTSFGRDGEEEIALIRNVDEVFRGADAVVETLTTDVDWPNHASLVKDGQIVGVDESDGMLIVANGFFRSRENTGTGDISLYSRDGERTLITAMKDGYFYHATKFHDMNGDGIKDIVTARAKVPMVPVFPAPNAPLRPDIDGAQTELLWLEQPADGLDSTEPWIEHMIAHGSTGVNIELVDMDGNGKVQILAAEFFIGKRLTLIECPKANWGLCTESDLLHVVVSEDDAPSFPPGPPAGTPGGPPAGTPGGPPAGTPGGPPAGSPFGGNLPCFVVPTGTPCNDKIPTPNPRRFFTAKFTDLNNDGVDDILATSSPHIKNSEGKVWAFERPTNWREDKWIEHILAGGDTFKVDKVGPNGSPGDVQAFYPVNKGLHKQTYPSVLVSGDDAGFVAVLVPKNEKPFKWEYSLEYLTHAKGIEKHTVGSPAIRYNERGFAQIAVPMYSDGEINFFTYDPRCRGATTNGKGGLKC